MSKHAWTAPAVHTDYGQLRQTLEARAASAGISQDQVEVVHRRWRSLGKRAAKGRL